VRFRAAQEHHHPSSDPQAAPDARRWRGRVRKAVGLLSSAAVLASSLVVVGAVATAAPAAAADPFLCTPGAVFVQSSTQVREFDVALDGGAEGEGGSLSTETFGADHSDNGLGISAGGRYAYTVTNSSFDKTLAKHDRVTNETTRTTFRLNSAVLRGAVHPETGVYYFASNTTNGGINLYAWDESVTPQTYVQIGQLRPTTGSGAFGANGDMAFSASGQLVLVADNTIYSADIPTTLTPSTAVIGAKQVHFMGDGVQGNGIAFGNLGHIFVSVSGGGNRIIEVDLPRGVTVNSTPLGDFSPTDMSSCTFPNTLTLKKDLPGGRSAGTDQFGLRVDSPDGYQVPRTDATTAGGATGLQPDYAGPIFTNQGDSFALSESAAGTAELDRYASSLSCVQQHADGSTSPVALSASNTVVQPEGSLGTDVTCVFVNDLLTPGLELRKTSDPVDGTVATAGQKITYTVEAENTGNTVLDPVEISDDLTGVVTNATYQDDVVTAVDGVETTTGAATVTDDQLSWVGTLTAGQSVTITYSVIVNEGAEGASIENSVTASGTPPAPFDPIVPPTQTTRNPVPGFTVEKTADPASGSIVEPGQVVDYTVTGTNTGATVLDPVQLSDDLSAVLAHAAYNDDIETRIDDTVLDEGAASLADADLTWTGSLQPGQVVTITYSVTVHDDAAGEVLRNTVSGSATPTTPDPADPDGPQVPGDTITPPAVVTEHPVVGSGFTISKTADPATGSTVDPGDTVVYTVTGTNTGGTVLRPVEITDNLAGALAHAAYNDDLVASRGTAEIDASTLRWTGTLEPGQNVVITYSVTVDADAGGETISNSVSATATPQIPDDPSDPDSPTTPRTPLVPPTVTTEHPVNEPGFTFAKSVDPASGAAVDPGQRLTYSLVGANTGETSLDVDVVDDLSKVLAHSTYGADATAMIDGRAVTAPAVVDGMLTWSGSLAAGEVLTITYSVRVAADAGGEVLENSATGTATPPGGDTLTPPPGTTTNPVNLPGFSLSKSADPATGTSVDPGSVITYTVTGVNTGETRLDDVTIVDDLSDVLSHAAYNDDAIAMIGGVEAAAPTADAGELSWAGALEIGQTVTIVYSVTVDGDAGGELIENIVSAAVTPPGGGTPIEVPPATTSNPVDEPGFEIVKSADPASGTRVEPGSVITYTVTGINTGETALDPVSVSDDLSGVLAHADYNADVSATVAGEPATAPTIADEQLTWVGDLAVGERVTIVYSVTVRGDAGGELLTNTASGTAVPPGGVELTPPPAVTEHPVAQPAFSFAKTSDPGSGSAVAAGDLVTYTLTGINTGEMGLDEVVIADDLSGVLNAARLTGGITATVGGHEVAAPTVEGTQLRWVGSLAQGETVTITYAVTVSQSAEGHSLRNVALATATPPGGATIPPVSSETVNPVLPPLAVTGGELAPWVIVLAVLLLLAGGLLLTRRRLARG